MAQQIKKDFNPDIPQTFLIVHWDGKLLPDIIATCDRIDRLAILLTGKDTEKLLGVPKLAKGTGAAMAEATVSALED